MSTGDRSVDDGSVDDGSMHNGSMHDGSMHDGSMDEREMDEVEARHTAAAAEDRIDDRAAEQSRADVPEQRSAPEAELVGTPSPAGTPFAAAVPEADLLHYDEDLRRLDRDIDPDAPHPADVAAANAADERDAAFDERDPEADERDVPSGVDVPEAAVTDEAVRTDEAAITDDAPITDEASVTDEAGDEAGVADGLKPGEAGADSLADLWDTGTLAGFRERWRDAQLSFVDDPHHAVEQARSVVVEAVDMVSSALTRQRDSLNDWQSGDGDTERLRMAMRRYRQFFDRVLDL